ncbi:hypothetical protein IWQ47_002154 [Aquimarina sp. EL_43]|uniref:Ig-like domain-containing protein n=1 Tax=unclassified Aquimarina TaxID=2627091 RepID=UPI0018CA8A65|nr:MULTISPECIES: Ig-like domain-containing protein [unclassified Aquimarina]MBG6130678.1 hypothetical protein [Aquimarina sp. EL_35]MBG6151176.1 hypothetical protein [Aquimarina sp. EL_32]MBG6169080.1 hypothetical protein [Aquimarina sp. EL_43]
MKFIFRCVILLLTLYPDTSLAQSNPSAIPFDYYVVKDKMQYFDLSALSDLFDYHQMNGGNVTSYVREIPWRNGPNGSRSSRSAFSRWVIESLPTNGKIYQNGIEITSPSSLRKSTGFIYIPSPDYVGVDEISYHAVETTGGSSSSAKITFHVYEPGAYKMPLGFPRTQWGLFIEPPADPPEWPNAESPIHWYIDSNCNPCSTGKGYPAAPRRNLPGNRANIQAGAKIVLAGTINKYPTRNNGSTHIINLNGTASKPVFIVGKDNAPIQPTIVNTPSRSTARLEFNGSYFVISGVRFENLKVSHHKDTPSNNIVVRHSEVFGLRTTNGQAIRMDGGRGLSRDISLFAVSVHDNGFRDAADENDLHGTGFAKCENGMILDALFSGNAGDSYQGLQHNRNGLIRIGRMKGHSEGENCVDIKAHKGTWVVDCDCWDQRASAGGNGQLFFQNDDDASEQDPNGKIIFLNNRGWDTSGDAMQSAIQGGSHYIVGNRLFGLPRGTGVNVENGARGRTHIYFNTVSDVRFGMRIIRPNGNFTQVVGNVIDKADINVKMAKNNVNLFDYNYYTGDPNTLRFQCCGNGTPQDRIGIDAWRRTYGHDTNGEAGITPDFNLASVEDFSLQPTSELIDILTQDQVDRFMPGIDEMLSAMGITFQDWKGVNRPFNTTYDIGAAEFGTPTPPDSFPIAQNDLITVGPGSGSIDIMVLLDNGNGEDSFGGDGPNTGSIVFGSTAPTGGVAAINDNGTPTDPTDDFITYTPNPGFGGIDTFTYIITDADGDIDEGTVVITVDDDKPEAQDDDITMTQDSPATAIYVLNDNGNGPDDFGKNGPSLTPITLGAILPANGTVTLNDNGTFTDPTDDYFEYTPNAGYSGPDRFNYIITDKDGDTDTGTVIIDITRILHGLDAVDDFFTVDEDTDNIFDVLANDSFFLGPHPIGAVLVITDPTNGSAFVNPIDNTIHYIPSPNYNGIDSFTYQITDITGITDIATVTITVNPVNDLPDAVDDNVTIDEDSGTHIITILTNDTFGGDGADTGPIEFGAISPRNGTAVINTNGTPDDPTDDTIAYTPSPDFNGTDRFSYIIADSSGDIDEAIVTIIVNPVNDHPDAVDDNVTVDEDSITNLINVLTNDSFGGDGAGTVPITIIAAPTNGTAILNDNGTPTNPTDDSIIYTPSPDFNGTDTFTYQITDANGDTDIATVTITVNPVNDLPNAVDDSISIDENSEPTIIDVLINDSFGGDGAGTVPITIIAAPTNGTAILNDNNTPNDPTDDRIVYTPLPNFAGTDSFTYQITDINGDTDTARVIINIIQTNSNPIAQNDVITFEMDSGPQMIYVLHDNGYGKDSFGNVGPGNKGITLGNTLPLKGIATLNTNNTDTPLDDFVMYTSFPEAYGDDIFDYTITNAMGEIDKAVVYINITKETTSFPVAVITPNPTSDITYIDFRVERSGNFRVIDAKGAKIYNSKTFKNQQLLEIDLSTLANGVYYIKLQLDSGSAPTFKVVKE